MNPSKCSHPPTHSPAPLTYWPIVSLSFSSNVFYITLSYTMHFSPKQELRGEINGKHLVIRKPLALFFLSCVSPISPNLIPEILLICHSVIFGNPDGWEAFQDMLSFPTRWHSTSCNNINGQCLLCASPPPTHIAALHMINAFLSPSLQHNYYFCATWQS